VKDLFGTASELTLTDGSIIFQLDSKLWAEQIFGWYYFVDQRAVSPKRIMAIMKNDGFKTSNLKQYLISCRGSQIDVCVCIQSYF
jgi:hypothetical protein